MFMFCVIIIVEVSGIMKYVEIVYVKSIHIISIEKNC